MPCAQWIGGDGQRPQPEMAGLERVPMLTSPLGNQEPLARSAQVRTLGWRLSPRRFNPGVKQRNGVSKRSASGRWPLANQDEGTLTRASGGA